MIKELQQDLELIFGYKVIFDNMYKTSIFSNNIQLKEQEVLFCDVKKVQSFFNKEEVEGVYVSGVISYMFLIDKADYDLLQRKWQIFLQSNDKTEGVFHLDNIQSNINYVNEAQQFTKTQTNFNYFIKQDFNKVRNEIKNLKITIKEKEN